MSTITSTATEAGAPALTFFQRVTGVFTSPRKVFESLRSHPVWLDVLILYIVVGVFTFIPMQPIIQREAMENARERIASAELSEEQKTEAIERQEGIMSKMLSVPAGIATVLIVSPIMFLFWALVVWFVYGFMIGGQLTFGQAFAAVSHLALIQLLGGLVKLPLILAKGSMYVATSLALVLPEADPSSPAWAALNAFDIFTIWILITMAIGMVALARVSPGKSRGAAIGIFVFVLLLTSAGALLQSLGKRG
jgi:uncharacterized membrane protein (DUF106 family)